MMDRQFGAFLLLAFIPPAAGQTGAPEIRSTFDNSTEGWTCAGALALTNRPAGGAPGGYLFVDNSERDPVWCTAPSKFTGDLRPFIDGTLSFDGNMLEKGAAYWTDEQAQLFGGNYGTVRITSRSGTPATISRDVSPDEPPQNKWTNQSIRLSAHTWGVSETAWATFMSSVTKIEVSLEAIFGPEQQGLDNFSIKSLAAGSLRVHPSFINIRLGPNQVPDDYVITVQADLPNVLVNVSEDVSSSSSRTQRLELADQQTTTPGAIVFTPKTLGIGEHHTSVRFHADGYDAVWVPVKITIAQTNLGESATSPGNAFPGAGVPLEFFHRGRWFGSNFIADVIDQANNTVVEKRPQNALGGSIQVYRVTPSANQTQATTSGDLSVCPTPTANKDSIERRAEACILLPYIIASWIAQGRFNVVETHLPYETWPGQTTQLDDIQMENTSDQPVTWTVRVVQDIPIIGTENTSGVLAPGERKKLRLSVNPGSLSSGTYHATLIFNPFDVVTVTVRIDASNARISHSSSAFQFVAAGAPPAAQDLTLRNFGTAPYRFNLQLSAQYTATPRTGSIPPGGLLNIKIQPNFAVNVPVPIPALQRLYDLDKPADPPRLFYSRYFINSRFGFARKDDARAADACTPSRLLPILSAPAIGFAAQGGFPIRLRARIVDDCGRPAETGQVTVQPDNGDALIDLSYDGAGEWIGTWSPVRVAGTGVALKLVAFSPDGSLFGEFALNGTITPSADPIPGVDSSIVVNAANQQKGRPHAPGEFITIYGSNLADRAETAQSFPLPATLGGVSITLGGIAMPLLYAGPTQVNAIVPYGLAPGQPAPLLVRRGSRFSQPVNLVIAPAHPGIFTVDQTGQGAGIFADSRFQLITGSNPARAGSAVIAFVTGLGEVDPPVPAGAQTPSQTLSRTRLPVRMTIGGISANVSFAGLAPGFAGLYQINAEVPAGVTPGDAVPVVITAGDVSGPPATIVVR